MKDRLAAGMRPVAFKLVGAKRILNQYLSKRFEATKERLKGSGRSAEEQRVRVGFHGARENVLVKIAEHGLLRVGHALNPSKAVDAGKSSTDACFVPFC